MKVEEFNILRQGNMRVEDSKLTRSTRIFKGGKFMEENQPRFNKRALNKGVKPTCSTCG